MSDHDRLPAPLDALVRTVGRATPDGEDQRASTFARGLALGAFVGAAIAGSTIWQRRHASPRATPNAPGATSRTLDGPRQR